MPDIKSIIQLHVAMMLKEIMSPYVDVPLTLTRVMDISQLTFEFRKELLRFSNELGEPSSWDEGEPLTDDEQIDYRAMIERSRCFASEQTSRSETEEAMMQEFDRAMLNRAMLNESDKEAETVDLMAVTRDLSKHG